MLGDVVAAMPPVGPFPHIFSVLRVQYNPRGSLLLGSARQSYTAAMDAGRDELRQLIEQLPDHEVASLLALARAAESQGPGNRPWSPVFFAFGPAKDGRPDANPRMPLCCGFEKGPCGWTTA